MITVQTIFAAVLIALSPGTGDTREMNIMADAASTDVPTTETGIDGVVNYKRASASLAISGRVDPAAVPNVVAAGFRSVLDVRGADENGVSALEAGLSNTDVSYVRVALPTTVSELPAFLSAIRPIMDAADNYPMLIACGSGNRAAATWALYRADKGTDADEAIAAARAVGLQSREQLVRDYLSSEGAE